MLKQDLLRGYIVQVNMKTLNRKLNTKAMFNQRDNKTAMLLFQLSLDGVMDLTSCKVMASVLKNDNTQVAIEGQIVDALQGIVAVGLSPQALACIGETLIELTVYYNEQELYSPTMSFIVTDNLFDEIDVISEDDFQILRDLIRDVQGVENELDVLETTINTNEVLRQANENTREQQEITREQSVVKMREDVDAKLGEVDTKIEEVLVSIDNMDKITILNTTKIDDKIIEINRRIGTIEETFDNKVVEVDDKIVEVTKIVSDKVVEINNKIKDIDAKVSGYNSKIVEVDDKIKEVTDTMNSKADLVDGKISGYENKIQEIDNLKVNIQNEESNRVSAENQRTETFNALVAELEVTQSDIDEILGMVGGL
ncbi:MAG: BppU family phage baseplate upper protein [Paraclostridium sp.]